MPGFDVPGFDVLDPSTHLKRNYFLEASAGTGKTFTIENTVVRLIQEGIPIDQILVVTFTRAATLELKTRIRRNLEEKKLTKALLDFDEAKIFTIHGFCFHTLKEHALETGFILNQTEESASRETLKSIFKDFMRTSLTMGEIHPKQLEKVLKIHHNDFERLFKGFQSPFYDEGKRFEDCKCLIIEEIKRLALNSHSLFEELLARAPLFGKMCNRQKQLKEEIKEGLCRFAALFDDKMEDLIDLPILKMVPENLLQNKGPYPDTLQLLNQRLIPLLAELSNPKVILNRLRFRFHQFLTQVCENEDLYFYDDLLKHMRECAHKAPFAEKIRASYQVVLIDEFQDTDPIQWDIFSTLFLGHVPLHLVGDPKQSIYRFRGADLYTYMHAKELMGQEAHATLTQNFRSEPAVVEGLNTLFGQATELITLPKTGQKISIPAVHAALPESDEGKIIFCKSDDERTLFSFIVNEIEMLQRLKKIPYSECAVLVKDRYQAKRFTQQCPLPFVTKKSESLLDSDAFCVLEDLLTAAYNPRERHPIVKVLGGPLYSIPLEELKSSLKGYLEQFYHYHQLLKNEGILPFFLAVVSHVSFPNETLYLDMLHLVEIICENTHSFEDYLPYLQKLKQEDAESDILKTRAKSIEDAVQVMTMHVAKGLEFSVVFPVGLILAFDTEDPEEVSEKMRQLYVSLTRAKKRLYLPLCEKENSPIHMFLTQVLKNEPLTSFIQSHPSFSLVQCHQENTHATTLSKQAKPPLLSKPVSLSFIPSSIHSYSSLMAEKEYEPLECPPNGGIPLGPDTGILLHRIFEHLDFTKKNLRPFLTEQVQTTILEPWLNEVENLVHTAIHFPLPAPSGSFCLAQLDPKKIKKEMEFLYPSKDPSGYVRGFIDLFFEHQNRYYIIDWKSNFLQSYSPEKIQESIDFHDYHLQATLYEAAAQKYLHLFHKQESFEGVFYVFLRGLNLTQHSGVHFFPSNLNKRI